MIKKDIRLKQRIVAFFLALVIIVGVLPVDVLANNTNNGEKITSNIIMNNNENTNKNIKNDVTIESKEEEVTKKYKVTFNPNGGSGGGRHSDLDLEAGSTLKLPKNEFTPPEGKEFKNWLVGEDELKEGHKLVVDKEIELKANWKDLKVNPVKKARNSLFSKNKEEFDFGKNIHPDAVSSSNPVEGDPEGNSFIQRW